MQIFDSKILAPTLRAVLLLGLLFVSGMAPAQTSGADYSGTMLGNVQRFTLHSTHASARYDIFVALPPNYTSTKGQYPMLVVLDAPYTIGTAVETARLQASIGESHELIVIGVGAENVKSQGMRRMRDFSVPRDSEWYLEAEQSGDPQMQMVLKGLRSQGMKPEDVFGGAALFYRFLNDELVPRLVSDYRVDRGDIGIFGHSAAGGFVNYILLHHPHPFQKLIIGSSISGPIEDDLPAKIKVFSTQKRSPPTRVFNGMGGAELDTPTLGGMFNKVMEFHRQLVARAPENVNVVTRIFPGETHSSVVAPVLASGIREMWGTGKVFGSIDQAD
jgi:predicted alpha/beta superfamily hydrolase